MRILAVFLMFLFNISYTYANCLEQKKILNAEEHDANNARLLAVKFIENVKEYTNILRELANSNVEKEKIKPYVDLLKTYIENRDKSMKIAEKKMNDFIRKADAYEEICGKYTYVTSWATGGK